VSCEGFSLGHTDGRLDISYIKDNFIEREASYDGYNCVFEAVCNAFQILGLLHAQVRKFMMNLVTDDDIDRYVQYYLSARCYREMLATGKGGDFELFLLARWAECRIVVFETKESSLKKAILKKDRGFSLFFERKRLDSGLHVVALTPMRNEFYVDYKKFMAKGKELNEILVGLMLDGPAVDNIDSQGKDINKTCEADSIFGNSLIDGLIDEINKMKKDDAPDSNKLEPIG